MGFRIDKKQITVTEYVYTSKRMSKEYELMLNKRRGK